MINKQAAEWWAAVVAVKMMMRQQQKQTLVGNEARTTDALLQGEREGEQRVRALFVVLKRKCLLVSGIR